MREQNFTRKLLGAFWLFATLISLNATAVIRDGGIDPANLGKGEWLYYMSSATNYLGGNVSSVTNENSLMLYMKSQGIRYVIVKAATDDQLFYGSYGFPQFTSNLVYSAHANGLWIFGYNRSYGRNVPGEIAIADFVFQQGADGFIWDAEAEWESSKSWITTNGPALAWQLCSAVRAKYPNKFLAHSPFAIIDWHSSFPYKEFGYFCDAIMPQIYHFSVAGLHGSVSAAINWTDANWARWHTSLATLAPTNINGLEVNWTNAIKPIVPIQDVYGPLYSSPTADKDVMEFMDYLAADPHSPSPGGYKGANYFRADLHGAVQWSYIAASELGTFPGTVNNVVMDDGRAQTVGGWNSVTTFSDGQFYGGATDDNTFGTNYLSIGAGAGTNYAEFRPQIQVPGEYDVYQWHPLRWDASASVPFKINYYGGSATVYANQQTNDGNWSLLGRYYFIPGSSATIRVQDNFPEYWCVAMVDGLKLAFATPTNLPSAAIRLSAAAVSSSQIGLAWTDTSTNESGFIISRSLTLNGAYTDVGWVPAGSTSYGDTGLDPNTTYYYKVRANNFLGSSSNTSAASAVTLVRAPVFGCGDNTWGQVVIPSAASNAVSIAAGGWHNLALRPDGEVVAWGNNVQGQCNVPAIQEPVLAIAAGGYHSLALKLSGKIIGWGANEYEQAASPPGLSNVVAIAAGRWHSLALKADGTVFAWGDNSSGQATVPPGTSDVIAIAAAGNHSLALRRNGTVVAWGQNVNGDGAFSGQSVVPFGLSGVAGIAAGSYHSLAVKTNGTVVPWGDNSHGQCSLPANLTGVVAVSGGGFHSVALRQDGTVATWGVNFQGQGNVPAGLNNGIMSSAGEYHTLILKDDPTPRPRLYRNLFKAGNFSTTIQTVFRKQYALEYSLVMPDGPWTTLATTNGNGGLRFLADPAAAPGQRYYRIRQF